MPKDKYLNIFSCQVNTIFTKEIKNSNLFLLSTHYCENVNIVFIILWIFFARHQSFKDWEYTWIFSNFSWGTFSHVTHIDQLCVHKNIPWTLLWDIQFLMVSRFQQTLRLCSTDNLENFLFWLVFSLTEHNFGHVSLKGKLFLTSTLNNIKLQIGTAFFSV